LSSKTLAFLESVSGTGLGLMANGLLQAPLASFFDFQMLSIIKDMREATVFHEAYKDTKNASPIIQENEYFQMKCVWAIYRLLTFSSQAGPKNIVTSIQEPCRVALLIFTCTNKNLYPPTSTLAKALTAQLKHSLYTAGMEILTLWVAAQDALIWILCLGAHISKGLEQRHWFVSWLAQTMSLREIYGWDNLKILLLKFFYLDSAYLRSLTEVWDEAHLVMNANPDTRLS
jgi:hypothetical protein